ncbi:lasso RiPP family leader peptide-containing protein [Streptomyces sp. NPDC048362]|uniref:lasso RiPP family leader peptide-containing protein n=1 Tax=unclassified Streptomyces TaxID=2593676 RepID=UPI00370FC54B
MTYDAFPKRPSALAPDDGQRAHFDGSPALGEDNAYVPPTVVDLGHVRDVTLGSSPSGNADANAQYYW